jgi:hypothetical protein
MAALVLIAGEWSFAIYDFLLLPLVFVNTFDADGIAASDLTALTNNSCDETTGPLLAEFFCYVMQQ